jgi:hypothetical protein
MKPRSPLLWPVAGAWGLTLLGPVLGGLFVWEAVEYGSVTGPGAVWAGLIGTLLLCGAFASAFLALWAWSQIRRARR